MNTQKPPYKNQTRTAQNKTEQVDKNLDNVMSNDRVEKPTPEDDQILCGLKPVQELLETDPARVDEVWLRRGARLEAGRILDLCRDHRIRFHLCEARDLERLVGPDTRHQGVAARLLATELADFSDLLRLAPDAPLPVIVALDQVQDPGNVGTLARTIYALGGAGLVLPKHNAAHLGPGARRAAAGALEHLPVSRVTNLSRALDEAREAGYYIVGAASGEGSHNLYTTPAPLPRLPLSPMILVLGSEESGLRLQVGKRCDILLHIPMRRQFDSLNVAQAGAVFLGELSRLHFLS